MIKTEKVQLQVADGTTMAAYVARPPDGAGKRAALLVLQEAFGVNEHIRDLTRRFAGEGYVAVAPELFHRTAPTGAEFGADDWGKITPHMQGATPAGIVKDVEAVHAFLQQDPQVMGDRIGAIGYCMGGRATFLANAHLPLKAAVSYYGGRIAPDLLGHAAAQHGPLLLVWGGLDEHIGLDQRQQVDEALRREQKTFATITFAQADHAFFRDSGPAFNREAARQVWALTKEFLATYLGG